MGYPDLDNDEPIILQSRNVKFKSISFDAILTHNRIHLTDTKKNLIPSQDIILTTIRNVERGENAIRDHFLILSLVTDAGEKYQTVLTFARQSGIERKRECDEWAKKLKSLIPPSTPLIDPVSIPEFDRESSTKREVPTPEQGDGKSIRRAKKRLEIPPPSGTIIEKKPDASERRETTSLPVGNFCSQCGNRVPLKSTFCNNCGTLIQQPSVFNLEPQPVESEAPALVVPPRTAPKPVITMVQETVPLPFPLPVVGKTEDTVQPLAGSSEERQGGSIEKIIQPVEPIVRDSVLNTQQYPAFIQKQTSLPLSEPSQIVSQAGSSASGAQQVIPGAESQTGPTLIASPDSPPPPRTPAPEGKKTDFRTIGILILVIIPILVGLVLAANIMSGGHANNTPVIPVTTTIRAQLTQTTPPDVTLTTAPVRTENSTKIEKGLLNISIGDYIGELPVFIDNKSVGIVSRAKPLNLTANVGLRTIRICVVDLCNNQTVIAVSSSPTTVDFGDWLKKEIVTGPLIVSIGGYNAELPVLVDNVTVGNVSQGRQLNLMVSEGNHTVKVCVGILCENETVEVKFAKPLVIDFGERLKKVAEFSKPTVRIIEYRQAGAKVTLVLEFINPAKDDLTFTTTAQVAYSYIDATSKFRNGNAKQITVTRSVKAGTRANQSSDIWLDGGRSYIIEIPQILSTTYK
jgi:hypothetical protein